MTDVYDQLGCEVCFGAGSARSCLWRQSAMWQTESTSGRRSVWVGIQEARAVEHTSDRDRRPRPGMARQVSLLCRRMACGLVTLAALSPAAWAEQAETPCASECHWDDFSSIAVSVEGTDGDVRRHSMKVETRVYEDGSLVVTDDVEPRLEVIGGLDLKAGSRWETPRLLRWNSAKRRCCTSFRSPP